MSEVISENQWKSDMKEEKVFKTLEWNPFRYMVVLTLDTYKAESEDNISELQLEFIQNKVDSIWIRKEVDSKYVSVLNFIKSDQKALYTLFYIKSLLIYYDQEEIQSQEREYFLLVMLKIPYIGLLKRMQKEIKDEVIQKEFQKNINQLLENYNYNKKDKLRNNIWGKIEEKFMDFVQKFSPVYTPQQTIEYYDEIMEVYQNLKEAVLNL